MKPIKILYFISFGFFASVLLLNATSFNSKIKPSKPEIPDSSKFLFMDIKNTFSLRYADYPNLNGVTESQFNNWVKPFYINKLNLNPHNKVYTITKLISYQKKHKNYYSIIVMIDDDIRDFYFLTISNNGLFIDGTTICSLYDLSNDDISKDTTDNSFIYSTEINSEFNYDSIIKFKKLRKSFKSESHDGEYWEESYKSIFIIDSMGKISNLTPYFKIN